MPVACQCNMLAEECYEVTDLCSLLREGLGEARLEVLEYKSRRLVRPGENFSSRMLQLEVLVRREAGGPAEDLHLVGKGPDRANQPLMDWSRVLYKEAFVYAVLRPAFAALEASASIGKPFDGMARYYGHRDPDQGQALLLLENLMSRGFYCCDRRIGVDRAHATAALTCLAKFHALSVALKRLEPNIFGRVVANARVQCVNLSLINEGFAHVERIFKEDAVFAGYRKEIESCFAAKAAGKPRETAPWGSWDTIVHGDFWTNNVLFRRTSEGGAIDTCIVDFQTYDLDSVVLDLVLFLTTSLNKRTLRDDVDYLIGVYLEAFLGQLKSLGLDTEVFTRESLEHEFKLQARRFLPLCCLGIVFTLFQMEPECAKLDGDVVPEVWSPYTHKCKERFIALLNLFRKKNWF